jgi:hypothetical protein
MATSCYLHKRPFCGENFAHSIPCCPFVMVWMSAFFIVPIDLHRTRFFELLRQSQSFIFTSHIFICHLADAYQVTAVWMHLLNARTGVLSCVFHVWLWENNCNAVGTVNAFMYPFQGLCLDIKSSYTEYRRAGVLKLCDTANPKNNT